MVIGPAERITFVGNGVRLRFRSTAISQIQWRRAERLAAILLAALLLCWPAILNGYALLYPDSLGYLLAGHGVWTKLLGIPTPAWQFRSDRSEIFAAGLFLLHFKTCIVPFLAVESGALAWVLWLCVRCLFADRSSVRLYLAVVGTLSVLTGVAWYVSAILADSLGPVLYLSMYLLVFAWGKLKRWEKFALGGLAFWALGAHATHLAVGAALCVMLGVLGLCTRQMRDMRPGLSLAAVLVVFAALMQMAVHHRLYGKASLFGNAPAFIMARLLGDGPARLYLQAKCPTLRWEICRHEPNLPTDAQTFLWPNDGIWRSSTLPEQDELRHEQMPLALATLRAYPKQQLAISGRNFIDMLFTVGPADFGSSPLFMPSALDRLIPGLAARYEKTLQARDAMPQLFFRRLERPTLAAAMFLAVLALPWLRRKRDGGLLNLDVVVLFVLLVNAFLGGVLSCDDARLQDRVSWLIAFVAALIVARYWQRPRAKAA